MSMVCPNCGKEYENKKFCTECGKKLIEKEIKKVVEEASNEVVKEVAEEKAEKQVVIAEKNMVEEKKKGEEKTFLSAECEINDTAEGRSTVSYQSVEDSDEIEKTGKDDEKETGLEKNMVIDRIVEKIGKLEKLFEERIRFTDFEENSRKEMYAELQKYKTGLYSEMVKPLLREIIDVRESMLKAVAKYQNMEEKNAEKILAELKSYADDDILSLLENYGVEIYQSEPGNDFSATKQRLRKPFVKTTEAELQGKIAESLSFGYTYNGQTIYGEWVKRYIYEASNQKEEQ